MGQRHIGRWAQGAGLPRGAWAGLAAAVALAAGLAIGLLPLGQLGLAAAGVGLAGIIAATLAEPAIGLAVTLFVAPFAPLENIMLRPPIESGQLLLGLTLGAWALSLLHDYRDAGRRGAPAGAASGRAVWLAMLVFVGVAVASVLAATSFEAWAKETLKWIEALAVCALVAAERQPRRRVLVLGAILVSGAFQGCFGIYQFALRGEGPDEFAILGGRFFRSYGTFEQPNPYGGYVGLVWPIAAGLAIHLAITAQQAWQAARARPGAAGAGQRRTALLAGAGALFAAFTSLACFGGLVLSWSRGAWLGAAAAAAVVVFVALRRPALSLAVVAGAAALIAVLSLAGVLPQSLLARLTDFTQQFSSFDVRGVQVTEANYSIIERLAHWQAAENMILDRPYTGVGFGNYEAAYDRYRALNWPIALGHAHNYYLNIWAETGVFGLLAYLAMWIAILARSLRIAWPGGCGLRRSPRRSPRRDLDAWLALGLLGAWVHLAVHQLVDSLYVANIYLLLGAAIGLLLTLARRQGAPAQPS